MSRTANRAQRRKASRGGAHESYVFPLELAMELNRLMPAPGLAEVLDRVMMESGMDVSVSLCGQCGEVTVLL